MKTITNSIVDAAVEKFFEIFFFSPFSPDANALWSILLL